MFNFTNLSEGSFVQTNCTLWALFADCFAKSHVQPRNFKSATRGPGASLLPALPLEQFCARRRNPQDQIHLREELTLSVPVAVQSKAWVCGFLGFPVRILLGAWMSVCCECCVLLRTGVCDSPIPRPQKSYRGYISHWVWSGAIITLCTDSE